LGNQQGKSFSLSQSKRIDTCYTVDRRIAFLAILATTTDEPFDEIRIPWGGLNFAFVPILLIKLDDKVVLNQ
jgi:hypothetical protein